MVTQIKSNCDTQDPDEAVHVVSDCIRFCDDFIIPTETVNVFSNNNVWVTKEQKEVFLNEKKSQFPK